MHDLLQFISNSGPFNLDQIRGDLLMHWGEQLKIENFLAPGNGRIVSNEELGQMVERLYKQSAAAATTNYASKQTNGSKLLEE